MSPSNNGHPCPPQAVNVPATTQQNEHIPATPSINDKNRRGDLFFLAVRILSVVGGCGVLAASTLAVIDAGHLTGSDANLVAALSIAVALAAIVLPRASKGMMFTLVMALLAGEAFNLLASAERIIITRENTASLITGNNSKATAAQARLTMALAAQTEQRSLAVEAVAMPSCAKECRALIERQATTVDAEVITARSDLATAPVVKSATPLADRLGVAPWALDLIAAALLSIGANGLGACLIAFGSATPRTTTAAPETVTAMHPIALHGQQVFTAHMFDANTSPMLFEPARDVAANVHTADARVVPIRGARAIRANRARASKPSALRAGAKQSPVQPAVLQTQDKIVKLVRSNDGRVEGSTRGLAALINASPTTTRIALAALVASGALIQANGIIELASKAA